MINMIVDFGNGKELPYGGSFSLETILIKDARQAYLVSTTESKEDEHLIGKVIVNHGLITDEGLIEIEDKLSDLAKHPEVAGIYIFEDDTYTILLPEDEPYNIDDACIKKSNKSEKEILEEVLDGYRKFNGIDNLFINEEELEKIRLDKNHQANENVIVENDKELYYDIHNDDDEVVTMLKETINNEKLMVSYVNNVFAMEGGAYNLIYGLANRHTITWDYLTRWAKVLNMDINLTLTKKEDEDGEENE